MNIINATVSHMSLLRSSDKLKYNAYLHRYNKSMLDRTRLLRMHGPRRGRFHAMPNVYI
jgi:hypothetical protein